LGIGVRELRFAVRSLRKQPGFTLVAVLTIALGVGANSAIFSVVDAVMLKPLPFANADRVVIVSERTPRFPVLTMSAENLLDVCGTRHSDGTPPLQALSSCGAYRNLTINLSGDGEPQRITGKMISANLLSVLGVAPAMGRPFTDAEDARGGEPVVILSHGLWQTRFGGARNVLGQRLLLDGTPYTVVGVMSPTFRLFQNADVYVPLGPFVATQPADRGWHPGLQAVGRLKDGVSIEQANTEAAGIAARLEKAYPETNTKTTMFVTRAQDLMVQGVRTALLVLLGAVAGVLLIACINVAGLLLARGLSRRRDVAVRLALGASHRHIVGHLLTESLLIALAGGLAGLLLAAFSVPLLMQLVGPTLPRSDSVGIDGRVVLFTLGLSLLTGIVFGLIPALQSARVDLRDTLSEAGRAGIGGGVWQRRARSALVVAEIALTIVLTIGAALLIRSFARLQAVTPGFSADQTLAADLPLSSVKYASDETRTNAVNNLLDRVRAIPGVRSAAVTTLLPLTGGGPTIHFNIKGRPPAGPEQFTMAGYRSVSGAYFETLAIPLRRGRLLDDRDRQGSPPVIVVNETMARQFFPGEDPLGHFIQLGATPDPDPRYPYMQIVGVVGDVKQQPDAEAKAEMYVPYSQYPDAFMRRMFALVTLVVHTSTPPAQVVSQVRAAVQAIDPEQPLANVRTLDDVVSASVSQPRFRTTLLGVFAGIALVLAAIGVYGLLAHGVAQRINEFGVRMALGASPGVVVRLVMRQGLTLAFTGIGLGLVLAVIAVRALNSVLFEVTPWDPIAWLVAAATLFAVALLASWLPARRALPVDPVVALRS
jgi:putative ABC transport system permease protein